MTVSKLEKIGVQYRVGGQVAVFLNGGSHIAVTNSSAICYNENDGYYDVLKARWNYVRGTDVKRWIKTKGRSDLTWEKAVKEYNRINNN